MTTRPDATFPPPSDAGAPGDTLWFLAGDDEMSARMRSHDWSATPLGEPRHWPAHLKAIVATLLATPFPIVLWWGPSMIQLYNDAARNGFDALQAPAALGQPGAVCWHAEWPLLAPQVALVVSTRRASRHEDVLIPITRGGRIEDCYWTYSYTPIIGPSGAVDGVLAASSESTERVMAQRRQAVLDDLRARVADCVALAQVRAGAREALRLSPRDVLAIRFADDEAGHAGGADDVAGHGYNADGLAGAALGGRSVTIAFTSAGAERPLSIRFDVSGMLPHDDAFARYLEQFTAIVAFAFQRIDAETARAIATEERDRLLLDAPVGAAVMIGAALTYQLVNPIYAMVAGRDAGWMTGKSFLEVFPELDGSPVHQSFLAIYHSGVPFVGGETLVQIHKFGGVLEDRYFTYNLSPLRRVDGSVYGLMVIAVDVTVQVEARQQVQALNAELNQAARAKDEFLALLGHELRNPLAPIVTAVELMALRETSTQREQAVIRRQTTHMVRLVDDLLDVSRITRGKIELRMEPVALATLVTKAVEMVQAAINKKHQTLTVEVAPIALLVDPARLTQVISNLLTNATKYTQEGGHIAVHAAQAGDQVTIAVRDDGSGIPAALMPRIFEPFVQGERKLHGAVGGLGIGLALVKNLVAMHGGVVTADSAGEAMGSVFTIVMPSGRDMSAAPASAPPHAQLHAQALAQDHVLADGVRKQHRDVLVVDDNIDAADFLAELLASRGHTVRVAYDPAVALRESAQRAPECAILDIGLPGMDGYALAKQLRALPGCADLPCIALTGFGQEADKTRSENARFVGHLVKPIEIKQLLELLATVDVQI